jgi:hypothetical protein
MKTSSIVLACAAMVALVFVVGIRMFAVRVREMREKRIHPQKIATSRQVVEQLQSVQASDNFRNLFEMPVLFYALCAMLIATGHASAPFAAGAWLFVILRAAHSYIHCTYNKVMHRFAMFVASSVVLLALWVGFAIVATASR